MADIFSPETLAERWGCSARHVRDLCNEGQLRHFKVGRMFRIRREALEEFEWRENNMTIHGGSQSSKESIVSPGMSPVLTESNQDDVIDLAPKIAEKRSRLPRLDTRNSRGLQEQR